VNPEIIKSETRVITSGEERVVADEQALLNGDN
jgi:hypothetical protein